MAVKDPVMTNAWALRDAYKGSGNSARRLLGSKLEPFLFASLLEGE